MSPPPVATLRLTLPREQVLRCLDYPPDREPAARVDGLLDAILPLARRLVQARGCWLELPVERCGELGLAPVQAEGLVLGLVTIGPELEAELQRLQGAGDLTRALLLDACGSAAAEEAADRLGECLGATPGGQLAALPPRIGCRISPGYGGWSLQAQPALLALLGAENLGVSLTPGLMMIPRKSISFAMWLGARRPLAQGLAGCTACDLARCRSRATSQRAAPDEEEPS